MPKPTTHPALKILISIKDHLQSLRPHQWIKNLFVFAGIIFVGKASNSDYFASVTTVFIAFCAVSSSGYLLNDLFDIKKDRNHPKKSLRPIASGKVSVIWASVTAACLLLFAIVLSTYVSSKIGGMIVLYALLTFSYSIALKNIVIIDIFIISLGFVVRVLAGAMAIGIEASPWLILCTLLISLFLAINKRRSELLANPENATNQRKNLAQYTPEMLSEMSTTVTSALILAYWLYSFFMSTSLAATITPGTPQRPYMMVTVPIVIYALFRYLYLIHKKKGGESPDEIIFADFPFLVSIFLWTVMIILIIYRPLWLAWMSLS